MAVLRRQDARAVLNAVWSWCHPFDAEDGRARRSLYCAVEDHRATPASIQKQIKEAKVSYIQGVVDRSTDFKDTFFRVHIVLMSDNLSAMLSGMGLMRMGFLTGEP